MQASQRRTNLTVAWVRLLLISGHISAAHREYLDTGVHQPVRVHSGTPFARPLSAVRAVVSGARLSRAKGHGSRRDRQTHLLTRLEA